MDAHARARIDHLRAWVDDLRVNIADLRATKNEYWKELVELKALHKPEPKTTEYTMTGKIINVDFGGGGQNG